MSRLEAPPEIHTAPLLTRGGTFERFQPGQRFDHRMRRTINQADNTLFSTSMLAFHPLYLDAEAARAAGHDDVLVNPMLVFCCVLGLSVEDLSEASAAFLGVDDLRFHAPVRCGDTLAASSVVVSARASRSRPDAGVVTWRTEGRTQRGDLAVVFQRANLVPTAAAGHAA